MEAPQDRYITVGRVNTRYWVEGDGDSPVVLIHGIGGYVEYWLPSLGALSGQHRVYALDMLGHGRTGKSPDASYEIGDLARFVRDFMEALEIERAHVVGHSLGGAIATRLALMYPEAVKKLVLVASAGLGKEVCMELRLCTLPVLGEMLSRPSRSASAQTLKMGVFDQTFVTDESIDFDIEMASLPGAQRSFLKTLRSCGSLLAGQRKSMWGPNLDGIGSIDKPVLVVWGRQDKVIPVEHAEVAAAASGNVRIELFDQCGHTPMLEHTEAFNELLLEFLAD
jgi:pimeloyl-ACP methyl ester carboxylesterase